MSFFGRTDRTMDSTIISVCVRADWIGIEFPTKEGSYMSKARGALALSG